MNEDLSHLIDDDLTDATLRAAAEAAALAKVYDIYVYKAERRFADREWLNEDLIVDVHYEVFEKIWDWAGKYRAKDKNLGVGADADQISKEVRRVCRDFKGWNDPESPISVVEIAARLHNRLQRIHPFLDGNGRIARLFTDIFLRSRRHPLPKWPPFQQMKSTDKIRKRYIAALEAADQDDFKPLVGFIKGLMR